MLPRIITKLMGWAVATFFDVERSGPRVPDGPVLVTANHPNSLVDPLVIFRTAGRSTRPLAKAPLFEQAVAGTMLKGLGGLPVYRKQDDPELMHLNDRTFDAAIDALRAGEAVQIYPEGQSHSEPAMTPIRTGAARIALMAEAASDWQLGLKIQPVGLTYTRKHKFRGRAVAEFGEPFGVADFRERYAEDQRGAARELTDLIRKRLERVTLNFDHPDDVELVDVAERLYARQKKLAKPRERQPLVDRLPRMRAFAMGVRWLRATDPDRLDRVRHDVRRYLQLLTLFGASEGDVPRRYKLGPVLRYTVRQLGLLLIVLPAALLGAVAWFPPFIVTRHVAQLFKPKHDQISTYKVGTALQAFPIWLLMLAAAAFFLRGTEAALATVLILPVLGFAAIAWRERQSRVRQDLRVFLRARRRSETRDRLREHRELLVAEFDALAEEWRADRARARAAGEP